MTILADHEIADRCLAALSDEQVAALCLRRMVEPFMHAQVESHGLSSYGYDLRLGRSFRCLRAEANHILDPTADNSAAYEQITADEYVLEPGGFVLAVTMEHLVIPRDVSAIVLGKSTYARLGLSQLCTPLEAGWRGFVTLELVNHASLPLRLRSGRGIVQVVFFRGATPPLVSYADRQGIYMDQPAEPVVSRR